MTNNALKILQSLFVHQNLQAPKILPFWVFWNKTYNEKILGCIKLQYNGLRNWGRIGA